MTHSRRAVITAFAATVAVAMAGCSGGGASDVAGATASASAGSSKVLNLYAYAVPKVGFDKVIPAFNATPQGAGVQFQQSYGASGDQSRKVASGAEADVVNFSVTPDITRLRVQLDDGVQSHELLRRRQIAVAQKGDALLIDLIFVLRDRLCAPVQSKSQHHFLAQPAVVTQPRAAALTAMELQLGVALIGEQQRAGEVLTQLQPPPLRVDHGVQVAALARVAQAQAAQRAFRRAARV